jgi:hypothetical protein
MKVSRTAVILIFCQALFLLYFLIIWTWKSNLIDNQSTPGKIKQRFFSKVIFNLTTRYETPVEDPVGVIFIAHACTHSANDFWPHSSECSDCVGLAEEVRIVQRVLSLGFIAIAISSRDRVNGCWQQSDISDVSQILTILRHELHVTPLPLISLGCSSGGNFVWLLSKMYAINGLVIQSMAVDTVSPQLSPILPHMPVIFNPMPRDHHTYVRVNQNAVDIQRHKEWGCIVRVVPCSPLPVTASYLLIRLWYLNLIPKEATLIVDVLGTNGYINHTSGYLLQDPTDPRTKWKLDLQKNLPPSLMKKIDLTPGRSPLAKCLNRAWAFHEYCADGIEESIDWLLNPTF